jgi:ABC-2 type transport system permease protein
MKHATQSMPRRGGRWMRVRALVRKESYQILRDPSSIMLALVMPVVLLLLFGYGVSLDARNVPVVLVAERSTREANAFTAHFHGSTYFKSYTATSLTAAEQAMKRHDVLAMVRLQADFDDRLSNGQQAPIQVIVNGVDANTARIIEGYVQGVWNTWLSMRAQERGLPPPVPLKVEPRVWFNAAVTSQYFLVPGLMVIIMTLIGALLTALVMAREWERGTMEAILVTPVRINEILVGKLAPYFVLGMGGMALSTAMAVFLFGVPLRGSFPLLVLASAAFMFTALGMGLLISTATRNQFVAGQAAIVATFLPAFFLSGFLFSLESTPMFIQVISRFVAARYFVNIVQTLFLVGNVWSVVWPNLLVLGIMGAFFLLMTRRMTHKRLE